MVGIWDIQAPGNPHMDEIMVTLGRGWHGVGWHDPNAKLVSSGVMRKKGRNYFSHFNPRVDNASSKDIALTLGSYGYSGGERFTVDGKATGDPNTMTGTWRYEKKSGAATWRRRPAAKLRKVRITYAKHGKTSGYANDEFNFGSRGIRIERDLRDCCKNFWVNITGDHLAGAHNFSIEPGDHIKTRDRGWRCRNGESRDYGADWHYCGSATKPGDGVVGLVMNVRLQKGIAPGPRTLWVDGQKIPIEFVIHGHPDQKKLPDERRELISVQIVAPDTLDPIDEVAIGERFRVRLTFAKDPGTRVTETVTIRASNGPEQKVRVTGNSRVIVSEPVSVVPTRTGSGRVEP